MPEAFTLESVRSQVRVSVATQVPTERAAAGLAMSRTKYQVAEVMLYECNR
jgi:hypothetical protein